MHQALKTPASINRQMASSAISSQAQGSGTSAQAFIKAHLETELPRRFGHPVKIVEMRWDEIERQTSFSAQILTLQMDRGGPLKLFVKDYSSSSLPKEGLAQRSTREHRVYRDLLSQVTMNTPHYYGAAQIPGSNGFYLLIEFVEGIWLDYRGFDDWTRAAAWLGQLHGAFTNHQNELASADYLDTHDAAFFRTKAENALKSVVEFSPAQASRLAPVLEGYDEIVNIMTAQPRTLVHGSFRLRNVLVTPTDTPVRICPVDWELAARGGGLYDLAFVADGFNPEKVNTLLDAYLDQFSKHAIAWTSREKMTSAIHCFRLHKIMKSLSDSVSLKFSREAVDEYVDMAIAVRQTIDDE